MRRLARLSAAVVLSAGTLVVIAAPPAGATDVGNFGEFVAAWEDPDETLITLTADINLFVQPDCPGVPPTRDSATDLVVTVDAPGITLTNGCQNLEDGLAQEGTGRVTFDGLTYLGNDNSGHGLNTLGPVTLLNGATVAGHGGIGILAAQGVDVDASSVSDNGTSGIVSTAGAVTLTDATIDDNDVHGIDATETVDVSSSSVSGNGNDGVRTDGDVTIVGSFVEHNDFGVRSANGHVQVSATSLFANGNGVVAETGDAEVVDSQLGGGGIFAVSAGSTATLTRSAVSDYNQGVRGTDGAVVTQSTFTGNAVGVIGLANASTLVVNSTFVDNTAGMGVAVDGDLTAVYTTVVGNGHGFAIQPGGAVDLFGSVLADNAVNCERIVTSSGYNWADDTTCALDALGDVEDPGGDPQLAPLDDNGGLTDTMLPADTSPLVSAIPDIDCATGIDTDQRGEPRPNSFGFCTIGAVEVDAPGPPPPPPPPPGVIATITLDPDTVEAGGQVEVTGEHFEAGSTTALTLLSDPVDLGEIVTDGDGGFVVAVTIPIDTDPGEHTVRASGTDAAGEPVDADATLTVTSPVAAPVTAPVDQPTPPGTLPFTGAGLALVLVLVALASIGAGTALTIRWRRADV